MSRHRTNLIGRTEVATGTIAFRVARPRDFAFKAGQTIDVVLADREDAGDATRHTFSIASAPDEPELVFATRMRDSAFKRALRELADGAPIEFDGPFGSLLLHRDASRPAVFLAGGIGITPFRSMICQAARDRAPRSLMLLFSNRSPADAPFLDELLQLSRDYAYFRIVPTMTAVAPSDVQWSGRVGVIDAPLLRSIRAEAANAVYYVAGPPGFVAAMRDLLQQQAIDDDDIRGEEFFGY